MALFYYQAQNTFLFKFVSSLGNKETIIGKISFTKEAINHILVLVVKWCYIANGLFVDLLSQLHFYQNVQYFVLPLNVQWHFSVQ